MFSIAPKITNVVYQHENLGNLDFITLAVPIT